MKVCLYPHLGLEGLGDGGAALHWPQDMAQPKPCGPIPAASLLHLPCTLAATRHDASRSKQLELLLTRRHTPHDSWQRVSMSEEMSHCPDMARSLQSVSRSAQSGALEGTGRQSFAGPMHFSNGSLVRFTYTITAEQRTDAR